MTTDGPDDSDLLVRMRKATRDEHERTERAVRSRFFEDGPVDRSGFVSLLAAFLGLYRPLERRLDPAADRYLTSFAYRSRTERLERDLRTLGYDEAALERLPTADEEDFPAVDDAGRLLGCLYVVEGSELGTRVLWKELRRTLDESAREADAFFGAGGRRTGRRWRAFRAEFERLVGGGAPMQRAVASARATFGAYREWMS